MLVGFVTVTGACGSTDPDPAASEGSSIEAGDEEPNAGDEEPGAGDDGSAAGDEIGDSQATAADLLPTGLVECATVPELPVTTTGALGAGRNPDDEVMGVLATYAEEQAETFAGLWIDRDHGGVLVLAFTDDPAPHLAALLARGPSEDDLEMVSPRPPIADDSPLGERDDVAVEVVQARFTEAELRSAQNAAFDGSISSLSSGSVSITKNRASFDLIDPTVADLTRLAELIDVEKGCVWLTFTSPPPSGPLDILPSDSPDQLLTCGGEMAFPRSALTDRMAIAESDHPAAEAMVAFVADLPVESGPDSDLPPGGLDWYVLVIGEESALFARFDEGATGDDGADDGRPSHTVAVDRSATGSAWTVSGWSFGCDPRVAIPDGLGRVEITFDPQFGPPEADDTTIALLVTERDCASGQEMGDRLLGPQVIETDTEVIVAFAATPVVGGATCQGNPATPVTVELDRPLGDRIVIDGMEDPAQPITEP